MLRPSLPGQKELGAEPLVLRFVWSASGTNANHSRISKSCGLGPQRPAPLHNLAAAQILKGTRMPSNAHLESIGMIVEIAGVASAIAGVVLSLHHWPAAAALIGGGVAYIIGKKLRSM